MLKRGRKVPGLPPEMPSWTLMPEQARFCCPADPWDVCTQTNPEQSQKGGSKCKSSKEESSVVITLSWVRLITIVGQVITPIWVIWERQLWLSQQCHFISEFPEAVGGRNRDAQPGKASGNASQTWAMGCLSRWDGLHHTQQWPHKTGAGGSSTLSEENTAKSLTGWC